MYGSRPWVQGSNVHEKWTMSAVLSESSMCDVGDTVRGGRGWQVPPTRDEQLYRLKLGSPGCGVYSCQRCCRAYQSTSCDCVYHKLY